MLSKSKLRSRLEKDINKACCGSDQWPLCYHVLDFEADLLKQLNGDIKIQSAWILIQARMMLLSANLAVRSRSIYCRSHFLTSKTVVCWTRRDVGLARSRFRSIMFGGNDKIFKALRNYPTLQLSILHSNRLPSIIDVSKFLRCDHQNENVRSIVGHMNFSFWFRTYLIGSSQQQQQNSDLWNIRRSKLSNIPSVHFPSYQYVHKNYEKAPHMKYMVISRNFATSFSVFGRHRTYSIISSRPGFLNSQTWKKNEQHNEVQHVIDNPSLMFENNKQNNDYSSKIDRRMSSIRTRILDHNKNIKEKIIVQRIRGVKAVKRLRRKFGNQKEDIKTIPNLLTTLRMASAPALAYLVVNDYFGCALSIFVLAGITDMLDGYIARNFKNQRTALGTALDPLADKLLISFLTLSLTSAGLIPVPLTVLILSRDAGLILASFVIRFKSLSPPRTFARYFDVTHVTAKLFPSTISKINTAVQLSYVACVLASPVFDFVDHPLLQALMYTTATTTFLSGLDYVLTWRRRLKIVKNK